MQLDGPFQAASETGNHGGLRTDSQAGKYVYLRTQRLLLLPFFRLRVRLPKSVALAKHRESQAHKGIYPNCITGLRRTGLSRYFAFISMGIAAKLAPSKSRRSKEPEQRACPYVSMTTILRRRYAAVYSVRARRRGDRFYNPMKPVRCGVGGLRQSDRAPPLLAGVYRTRTRAGSSLK